MGCDIHMSVYRRDSSDDAWTVAPDVYWDNRHYRVFAVLAGVRNGMGFAGCKTGEPVVPIAEPRGVPEDLVSLGPNYAALDEEAADYYEQCDRLYEKAKETLGDFGGYDHTPSWLLLSEIEAYNWDQAAVSSGVVGLDEFRRYQAEARPRTWSGSISGPGIVHISAEEMAKRVATNDFSISLKQWQAAKDAEHEARVASLRELGLSGFAPLDETKHAQERAQVPDRPRFVTRVEWSTPLREECESFVEWFETLPTELDATSDNIRLVFGFDS